MCEQCDYETMLQGKGLDPTPLREAVLSAIGDEPKPLAAAEIMARVRNRRSINKVTLYRILDLLVGTGLVKRLLGGDRTFRYGMGETTYHPDHPHFVCSRCGDMACLDPYLNPLDVRGLQAKGKGLIRHVDVRFEGTCERCLKAGT
jgi:Fur family ferric uptake transcriptional regulator